MVGDSIRRIRQAEEEAEGLVEAAAEQADRVRSDAKQEYSMKVLSAQEKARGAGAGLREQLLREADEEIRAIRKTAGEERRMISMQAGGRMDAAVRKVLGMLEGFAPGAKDD